MKRIFELFFAGSIHASVNCDDRPAVYADGRLEGENTKDRTWSGHLADDTILLAVKCQNTGGFGGFLASLGAVLISDSSWKCSDTFIENWYGMDFDDSHWSNAHILGNNSGNFKGNIAKFEEKVQWIWYDENNKQNTTVYCRGRTGRKKQNTNNILLCQQISITACPLQL